MATSTPCTITVTDAGTILMKIVYDSSLPLFTVYNNIQARRPERKFVVLIEGQVMPYFGQETTIADAIKWLHWLDPANMALEVRDVSDAEYEKAREAVLANRAAANATFAALMEARSASFADLYRLDDMAGAAYREKKGTDELDAGIAKIKAELNANIDKWMAFLKAFNQSDQAQLDVFLAFYNVGGREEDLTR